MPQSYTSLHTHIVFSTKDRAPLISSDLSGRLYSYLGGVLENQNGVLLKAGGTSDHVHLLAGLSPRLALADVLRVVKTNSSKWVHEELSLPNFGWQSGYAAFTVSNSNLDEVRRYIERQAAHHARISFQEEFLEFLKRHGLPYDERYIWT